MEKALAIQKEVQRILQSEKVYLAIDGTSGAYEVSNMGSVRSIDRNVVHHSSRRTKSFTARYKGKELKKHINKDGYEVVCVVIDGKRKFRYVHRLVGSAFIPNTSKLPEINHIDFNKRNNKANNLEWCTSQHNISHTVNNGRKAVLRGEDAPRSKIKNKDVLFIRQLLENGESQSSIARKLGVHKNIIWNISKGHTWKSV